MFQFDLLNNYTTKVLEIKVAEWCKKSYEWYIRFTWSERLDT